MKVLLCSALFKDVLADAKNLNLLTQKQNINILKMFEAVQSPKNSYQHLRKKLEKNPEHVFQLPTLKLVTEEIETNTEVEELLYQNVKVHYYFREKQFIKNNGVEIVNTIVNCYEKRYGNLFASKSNPTVNVNSDQGDTILFEIC